MTYHLWDFLCFMTLHCVTAPVLTPGLAGPSSAGTASPANAISVHHTSPLDNLDSFKRTKVTSFTSTQSPKLSSITPAFTVPYSTLDRECRLMATNFSYTNNICNAPNPDTYLASHKALYSCEDRCGQTLPYSASGVSECACDSKCVAYGDCCRNFPLVCPQVHQHGALAYGELAKDGSKCESGHKQFGLCEKMATPWDIYNRNGGVYHRHFKIKPLPHPAKTLLEWSSSRDTFSIADVSEGLIYKNNYIFYCNNVASTHFFIPKIAVVVCSRIITQLVSLKQDLQWCFTSFLFDALTPFHRPCNLLRIINCGCSNGKKFIDHAHNICLGENKSIPQLSRYKLWNHMIDEQPISVPDDSQCILNIKKITNGAPKSARGEKRLKISISPIPVVSATVLKQSTFSKTTIDRAGHVILSEDNEFPKSDSEIPNKSSFKVNHTSVTARGRASEKVKNEDIHFVVEISKSIERRLLCTSLGNYMTECQLLDCAHGYFLSKNPEVHKTFGGSECLLPLRITFQSFSNREYAPLCWCFKMARSLKQIGVWVVSIKTNRTTCAIGMERLKKDDPPLDVDENARQAKWPEPHSKWSPSLERFLERFILQSKSSDLFKEDSCGDSMGALHVCVTFVDGTELDVFGKPCNLTARKLAYRITNTGQRFSWSLVVLLFFLFMARFFLF